MFAASLASAGEGYSIGASAKKASVDINANGVDIDGDSTGYRVFGLYKINKNFGIEAGYSKFGEPNDNSIPSKMHVETDTYDVFAVATYPVTQNLSVVGKAGFAAARTETEIGDDDATETKHTSTDPALSLGGQYEVNETFAVRGEIEWLGATDAGAERMVSISGVVRFK